MALPLQNIRVLDLSLTEPGQFCTMVLAELGAEVIKIEEPERGCPSRGYGPPVTSMDNLGLTFVSLCHDKKSLALNLKSNEAREVLFKLVATSDVFFEGLRPSATKRLGIDYESLKQINPGLVYCSLTGFGQDGPYANLVGHELNNMAISGVLDVSERVDSRPVFPPVTFSLIGAVNAVIGILAALVARKETGVGDYVDVSMADSILSWMNRHVPRVANLSYLQPPAGRREGTELKGGAPWYNVYETKDGKLIALGALEDKFWEILCRRFGREDCIDRKLAVGEKRDEIFAFFRETFLTKTREEWFAEMKDLDAALTPVNSIEDVLTDPQILHRQMLVEREFGNSGKLKYLTSPIKFSDCKSDVQSPAPRLGQHTREILGELGYSPEEIDRLHQVKAVRLG